VKNLSKYFNAVLRDFHKDQRAAVTVDWVVLCAGVAIMVGLVIQTVSLPMSEIAGVVTNAITGGGS
jgi:hypothetical protein